MDPERTDLLETLRTHRHFLRHTVQGLTDDQARLTPTVSELGLGGLIKHVANTEAGWAKFVIEGPAAMQGPKDFADWGPAEIEARTNDFRLLPDETLAGVLADYDKVAAATDQLVATVDLNASHPLPDAPWFEKGATRSARRVFLHVIAETSQHAGHADILREAIDGQKTM